MTFVKIYPHRNYRHTPCYGAPTVRASLPKKNPLNTDAPSVHLSFYTHRKSGGVLASCPVWQISKCHECHRPLCHSPSTGEQNFHSSDQKDEEEEKEEEEPNGKSIQTVGERKWWMWAAAVWVAQMELTCSLMLKVCVCFFYSSSSSFFQTDGWQSDKWKNYKKINENTHTE